MSCTQFNRIAECYVMLETVELHKKFGRKVRGLQVHIVPFITFFCNQECK